MLLMSPLVPLAISATNGGSCRSAFEQPRQRVAEHAEVVGRDVARADAADVVQRVGGEDGDRPAVRARARRGTRPSDRSGRPARPGSGCRRGGFIFTLSMLAERIGGHRARLHVPAAVEDVLGRLGRAQADLRRAAAG